MKQYVALIGGASGAVGTALARELSLREEWKVYGFARRAPEIILEGVNYCRLYPSDAAADQPCVDLGGRRIIKKKTIQLKQPI